MMKSYSVEKQICVRWTLWVFWIKMVKYHILCILHLKFSFSSVQTLPLRCCMLFWIQSFVNSIIFRSIKYTNYLLGRKLVLMRCTHTAASKYFLLFNCHQLHRKLLLSCGIALLLPWTNAHRDKSYHLPWRLRLYSRIEFTCELWLTDHVPAACCKRDKIASYNTPNPPPAMCEKVDQDAITGKTYSLYLPRDDTSYMLIPIPNIKNKLTL